jgi:ABC-type antimicrobial peptide transport system permease subunit
MRVSVPPGLVAQLSVAFGILGIVLASMGLYAAIAHTVSARTREIGIRLAIGAGAREVIWMVLKESLRVTAIGVLIESLQQLPDLD